MATNPFVDTPASAPSRKAIAESTPGVARAARWFWWIAGLSVVNSVMIHSGSETSFVIGLGFTLIADTVFQELKAVAFAIDGLAVSFFVAIGWFALRGHVWAFAVGSVFYILDALIYLYFEDFMPLAFHVLALVYIISGALALRRALKAARESSVTPPLPAIPAPEAPRQP